MKDIFQNNFNQFLNFGTKFLLLIVIFKTIGVNKFSELSFIITLITTYGQSMTFGSLTYLMNKKSKESKNSLKMIFLIFFTTIIFFSLILYYQFDFKIKVILIIEIMSLLYAVNLVIVTSEKSKGNFLSEMKIVIIQAFITVMLCITLFFKHLDVIEVLLVLLASYCISLAVNINILSSIISEKSRPISSISRQRSFYGFQDLVYLLYSNGLVLILYKFMTQADYGNFRAILLIFLPIGILVFSISQVMISKYDLMKDKINLIQFALIFSITLFYLLFKDIFFLMSGIEMTTELSSIYNILIIYCIFNILNMKYSIILIVNGLQKIRFFNSLIVSIVIILLLVVVAIFDNISLYTGPILMTASFIIISILNYKGTVNENCNNGR
jgi:O-antigen/teichoic acid export membrane protein